MGERPYIMAITMICRVYGENNLEHLKLEWVPYYNKWLKMGKCLIGNKYHLQIFYAIKKFLEAPLDLKLDSLR